MQRKRGAVGASDGVDALVAELAELAAEPATFSAPPVRERSAGLAFAAAFAVADLEAELGASQVVRLAGLPADLVAQVVGVLHRDAVAEVGGFDLAASPQHAAVAVPVRVVVDRADVQARPGAEQVADPDVGVLGRVDEPDLGDVVLEREDLVGRDVELRGEAVAVEHPQPGAADVGDVEAELEQAGALRDLALPRLGGDVHAEGDPVLAAGVDDRGDLLGVARGDVAGEVRIPAVDGDQVVEQRRGRADRGDEELGQLLEPTQQPDHARLYHESSPSHARLLRDVGRGDRCRAAGCRAAATALAEGHGGRGGCGLLRPLTALAERPGCGRARVADDDRAGRDVLRHDRAGADCGAVADLAERQHGGVDPELHAVADLRRAADDAAGREVAVVAHDRVVADVRVRHQERARADACLPPRAAVDGHERVDLRGGIDVAAMMEWRSRSRARRGARGRCRRSRADGSRASQRHRREQRAAAFDRLEHGDRVLGGRAPGTPG
jgi:hypothetical protein